MEQDNSKRSVGSSKEAGQKPSKSFYFYSKKDGAETSQGKGKDVAVDSPPADEKSANLANRSFNFFKPKASVLPPNPPVKNANSNNISTSSTNNYHERVSVVTIAPYTFEKKKSNQALNSIEQLSENNPAYGQQQQPRSHAGSNPDEAQATQSVAGTTFSPAAPLSLLVPKGTEAYISMPEIPDDCKVHVQATRCFQMKDYEIEALYREKMRTVPNKDETIVRQKELITRLQTGLCCLHMNKKRFVQECTGVEDRYNSMLQRAYKLLRNANRELHIACKKLQVVEMDAVLRNHELRRKGSDLAEAQQELIRRKNDATSADHSRADSQQADAPVTVPSVSMNIRTARDILSDVEDADDAADSALVSATPSQAALGTEKAAVVAAGARLEESAQYQLSSEEELADLEAQLSRAQALSAMLMHFQNQLLAEAGVVDPGSGSLSSRTSLSLSQTQTQRTSGSLSVGGPKNPALSPLNAARLLSLQRYTSELKTDVSATLSSIRV